PPDDGTTPPPDDETTPPDEDETTPPPTGDACTAVVRIVNDWGSGWQADVDVTAGGGALDGWTLRWTWPGGQTIASSWNAQAASSGSTVTASAAGWNVSLAAGQTRTATWGLVGSGTAVAPPVACAAG